MNYQFSNLQNLKYFLYVGNAYPHKNLEGLLEAFSRLQSTVYSLQLILVGTEDYFYKRLKDKVEKMGLKNEVIFYGPATRDELNNLYRNATALVFPSLMEGFGLPGLEAMANGCPVICSDIPVFKEIYGEAAVYFDPNNIDDIREKMTICLNDSNQLSKIIEKGKEQSKKYSWEKLARQTLAIYQEVC